MKTYRYIWLTDEWLRSIPRAKKNFSIEWITIEDVHWVSPEELAEIIKGIDLNE